MEYLLPIGLAASVLLIVKKRVLIGILLILYWITQLLYTTYYQLPSIVETIISVITVALLCVCLILIAKKLKEEQSK